MKKFLVIVVCITLILFGNVSAFADVDDNKCSESTTSYQIYEYDEIIKCRNTPESELHSLSISEDLYNLYRSDYVENYLLELKGMTSEELYYYGYTDEQIAILRNYNGESLENASEMRAVLSTLTISFTGIYHYTNQYRITVNWYWSTKPSSFSLTRDGTAALAWVASGSGGTAINSQYNSSPSYCTVWYYDGSGITQTYNSPMTVINPYSGVRSTHISMSTSWAKSGQMTVEVNSVDSGVITQMCFVFSYSVHSTTTLPNISVSVYGVSVSLNLSSGMTELGSKSCTYDQNGNLTTY